MLIVISDTWQEYKRTLDGLATIIATVADFPEGEAFLQKANELAFRAGYQHGRNSTMKEFAEAIKKDRG
jgi:hypothetical protein